MVLTDIEYIFNFLVILSIQQNTVEAVHFPSFCRLAPVRGTAGVRPDSSRCGDPRPGQAGLPRQVSSFEKRGAEPRHLQSFVQPTGTLMTACSSKSEIGERWKVFDRGRRPWPSRDPLQLCLHEVAGCKNLTDGWVWRQ